MIGWLVGGLAAALAALAARAAFALGRRRGIHERRTDAERLRTELGSRLNELYSLQELSYVLAESLQLDRIAEQVTKYLTRFVNCDGAMIALTTDDGPPIRIAAAEGVLQNLAGKKIAESESGLIGDAMGREHIEVAHASDGDRRELIRGTNVSIAAVAPLRAHGVMVGAIATVRDTHDPFSAEDLRQISTVATHTAVVLENARFYGLIKTGKEQWEATFDALEESVAVVDERGRLVRGNRALARLVSQPIPKLAGAHLCDLLVGTPMALTQHFDAARAGTPDPPLTIRTKKNERTLRISAAGMPGSQPGWVVALIEDVTEREAMEAQLIQHEKMAAVGQLVSGVAHELNNPLASIAGLSEYLLHRESVSDQHREHMTLIHEQAERAGQIVRNLLTFARTGPVEITSVDLNDIVRRTAALMEYELRLREVSLNVDLAPDLPTVRGDRHQLQQVMVNVLTNAVHAVAENPTDRPRSVEVITVASNGHVDLVIADSGPGIDDDLLPKIFTPFFTTKGPGEGTGLGLSISYRIVEGHGGSLTALNRKRGGSEFRIKLPAASASKYPPAAAAAENPGATLKATPCEILLVDDDPAVLKALAALFASDGHNVREAECPAQALVLLSKRSFDLIVAEPQASTGNGVSFAEALFSSRPDLREHTIFVTADVRPATEQWLQGLGCNYFFKPFNTETLRKAAAELLLAQSRK